MKGLMIFKRLTFGEIDYQIVIYITDRSKDSSFSHFGPFCRFSYDNGALLDTKNAVKYLIGYADNFPKRQKMRILISFQMVYNKVLYKTSPARDFE